MSEYAQTQRRFAKLKQTFDKLIEQNSYKNLRTQIEALKEQKKKLILENAGLRSAGDAQLRIIKKLELKLDEQITPPTV